MVELSPGLIDKAITAGSSLLAAGSAAFMAQWFNRRKNAVDVKKTETEITKSLHEIERDFTATVLKELAETKSERDDFRNKYHDAKAELLIMNASYERLVKEKEASNVTR